jgi:hypothetical protein
MEWVTQIANAVLSKHRHAKVTFDPPLKLEKRQSITAVQYLDIRVYGETFIIEHQHVDALRVSQLKINGYGAERIHDCSQVEHAITCLEQWLHEAKHEVS